MASLAAVDEIKGQFSMKKTTKLLSLCFTVGTIVMLTNCPINCPHCPRSSPRIPFFIISPDSKMVVYVKGASLYSSPITTSAQVAIAPNFYHNVLGSFYNIVVPPDSAEVVYADNAYNIY